MQNTETLPLIVDDNSPEAVGRLGREVYELHVRPKLRPEDHGLYAAIDVDSGDFEVLHDGHPAVQLLRDRRPAARVWITRVGERTAEQRLAAEFERMKFKRIANVAARGERTFESHVRPKLRPEEDGLFVAVDVETGDFEVHGNRDTAVQTLRERRPTANIWATMIGRPAANETPRAEAVGP